MEAAADSALGLVIAYHQMPNPVVSTRQITEMLIKAFGKEARVAASLYFIRLVLLYESDVVWKMSTTERRPSSSKRNVHVVMRFHSANTVKAAQA